MINPTHGLSLTRQAELLEFARASLYYKLVETCEADLKMMRRIDELHLQWPFLGSRMLRDMLRLESRTHSSRPFTLITTAMAERDGYS
jgi:putative transposase